MNIQPFTTPRLASQAVPDLGTPLALAVVVPTLNEAGNVAAMVAALDRALAGVAWEAIFVDDNSTDGTAGLLREIGAYDRRIRVIQRLGRRGLSSAVTEGILATAAPLVAVIDGDMQHDEALLPQLYAAVTGDDGGGGCDLAIGSRYVAGGAASSFGPMRALISRVATRLSNAALRSRVTDPMSGFFLVRHACFMASAPNLSNIGFKILMDLLASSPAPLTVRELPYHFRVRHAGESKLDPRVAHEFLVLLLEKLLGRYVPVRFLMFAMVGTLGLVVNLLVVGGLLATTRTAFDAAAVAGVAVATAFNYSITNTLTYRDMRRHGVRLISGFATYALVCGAGAVANAVVADRLYRAGWSWWPAILSGAVIALLWNYAATARWTWRVQ